MLTAKQMNGAEVATQYHELNKIAEQSKELWKRHMTPNPGEPGSDTWPQDESYKRGGGATWITGSYDPELDLT